MYKQECKIKVINIYIDTKHGTIQLCNSGMRGFAMSGSFRL